MKFSFNTSIQNFDLHSYLGEVQTFEEEQIKQNIIEFVSDCIVSFVVGELNQDMTNTNIFVDFEM